VPGGVPDKKKKREKSRKQKPLKEGKELVPTCLKTSAQVMVPVKEERTG